ncbi:MAG TPA: cytochrome c oxidase subunit 3 [Candidatus Dormibacteraeota bacterium]|nr:cytochrome c oxidase subunit 3 [Candidatus Dormibacteraeota bacterium]
MSDTAIAERAGIGASVTGRNGGGFGGNGNGSGGNSGASHTPQRAYVTGMVIALSGIAMFFMALISAAVVRRGSPSGDWRPLIVSGWLARILWLNTLVLLGSSATMLHARSRARAGDETGFRQWWIVTSALGVCFLAGQLLAWRQLVAAGLYLATNPSSSFFYLITAAHGVHLAGGIIALLVVAFRPARRMARGTPVEIASMYWHAMDAIWMFLFFFLISGGRS